MALQCWKWSRKVTSSAVPNRRVQLGHPLSLSRPSGRVETEHMGRRRSNHAGHGQFGNRLRSTNPSDVALAHRRPGSGRRAGGIKARYSALWLAAAALAVAYASGAFDRAPRMGRQGLESPVYYRRCADARAAGAAPIYVGQPGYRAELDGDGDGIACEPYHGH